MTIKIIINGRESGEMADCVFDENDEFELNREYSYAEIDAISGVIARMCQAGAKKTDKFMLVKGMKS
jgi:hypothetical protein